MRRRRGAPAGGRRAERRPGGAAGRLVAADRQRPQMGRTGRVGVLAVRKGVRYASPLPSDDREGGRVPGYVNVPAIVAAAASLRAVRARRPSRRTRGCTRWWSGSGRGCPSWFPRWRWWAIRSQRLPHLVTFSCLYVDGEVLLTELDRAGYRGLLRLLLHLEHPDAEPCARAAMGVLTEGNVRVSLPYGTTEEDVERFLALLPEAVGWSGRRSGSTGLRSAGLRPRPGSGRRDCASGGVGVSRAGRGGGPGAGTGDRHPGAALPDPGDRARPADRRSAARRHRGGALRRRGRPAGHPRLVHDAGPGLRG